jgi:hypothetical protein
VDEAGSLYGAALAIKYVPPPLGPCDQPLVTKSRSFHRPDNYASYEALCYLISFLAHSGGHSKSAHQHPPLPRILVLSQRLRN